MRQALSLGSPWVAPMKCDGWPVGSPCDLPAIGGDEDGNLGCVRHAPRFFTTAEAELYLDTAPGEAPARWVGERYRCETICTAPCEACPFETLPNDDTYGDPIDELLWALFGWLWALDPDGQVYWPGRA